MPAQVLDYDTALAFARHWIGKGALFAVIALFLWHAAHRLHHALHDLGVHTGTLTWMMCYGTALTGTFAAAVALLSISSDRNSARHQTLITSRW